MFGVPTILLVMLVLMEICTFSSGIAVPAQGRRATRAIQNQIAKQFGDSLCIG